MVVQVPAIVVFSKFLRDAASNANATRWIRMKLELYTAPATSTKGYSYFLLLEQDTSSPSRQNVPEPITIGRTLGESYGIFKHLVFPARFLGRCVCLYQGDGTLGATKQENSAPSCFLGSGPKMSTYLGLALQLVGRAADRQKQISDLLALSLANIVGRS